MKTQIKLIGGGDYTNSKECPIAKGLKANGFKNVSVGPYSFSARLGGFIKVRGKIPHELDYLAYRFSVGLNRDSNLHTLTYKISL